MRAKKFTYRVLWTDTYSRTCELPVLGHALIFVKGLEAMGHTAVVQYVVSTTEDAIEVVYPVED